MEINNFLNNTIDVEYANDSLLLADGPDDPEFKNLETVKHGIFKKGRATCCNFNPNK